MNTTKLTGLTWGHRRAINPLTASAKAFSRLHPSIEIEWKVRTLQQFEHQPFADAVASADIVIFDHPYCGTIARDALLWPLDETLADIEGGLNPESYVGPSLTSYQLAGRTWAVPVDGATVHAVYREDLLGRVVEGPPSSWLEVIRTAEVAQRKGFQVIIAAQGHHALLTVASLMANLGGRWEKHTDLDAPSLSEALDLIDRVLAVSDRSACLAFNAIDVHEQLASSSTAAYCPAAYGYATYGEDGVASNRLSFAPFPGPNGSAGAILGGAGAGVSRASRNVAVALLYVGYLAQKNVQQDFAHASGQPARVESWSRKDIDGRFNGFFSGIASSMKKSVVRPRDAGYAAVEQELAGVVSSFLHGGVSRAAATQRMRESWRRFS